MLDMGVLVALSYPSWDDKMEPIRTSVLLRAVDLVFVGATGVAYLCFHFVPPESLPPVDSDTLFLSLAFVSSGCYALVAVRSIIFALITAVTGVCGCGLGGVIGFGIAATDTGSDALYILGSTAAFLTFAIPVVAIVTAVRYYREPHSTSRLSDLDLESVAGASGGTVS